MFDLRQLPETFYDDPFPTYAALRRSTPVLELPDGGFFLTRHADLNAVYRDARRFSSDKKLQFGPVFGTDSALFEHHTTSLVFNDPPLHTRVRKAIGNVLSAGYLRQAQFEASVTRLVAGLLDHIADADEIDIVRDFASRIPVEIIGNLMGIPADERAPLRDWSLNILGSLEVDLDEAALEAGETSVREFCTYLEELLERRRRLPATDDLLSRLANWENDGYRLSGPELLHQCVFLLNAGHETTTNLIANGIELLIRYPDARRSVLANPELIDGLVEEALRFEAPNQLGNRTTTERVEIGGLTIPRDCVLTLCIGAANRDPAVFESPEQFLIARSPNPHLAFGAGVHTCAGLNVARLEARVALLEFCRRIPDPQLIGPAVRARRARFRGFDTLIVTANQGAASGV